MSDKHQHGEQEHVPATRRRKAIPLRMASGPSFVNPQVMPELLRGYKMSDVIAVLGSLDFVVGEVDR